MRSRRAGREAALQALYQCDTLGDYSPGTIALYFSNFSQETQNSENLDLTPEEQAGSKDNREFCDGLISGVLQYLDFLDSQLNIASTHWSVSRMTRIDRNILRIGAYELGFAEGIPPRVVMNEAIEIAKRYGADESAVFVNGVLDKVAANFSAKPNILVDAKRSYLVKLQVSGY